MSTKRIFSRGRTSVFAAVIAAGVVGCGSDGSIRDFFDSDGEADVAGNDGMVDTGATVPRIANAGGPIQRRNANDRSGPAAWQNLPDADIAAIAAGSTWVLGTSQRVGGYGMHVGQEQPSSTVRQRGDPTVRRGHGVGKGREHCDGLRRHATHRERTRRAPQRAAVIYGGDGRNDYFEEGDPSVQELVARSTVALVPNRSLDPQTGGLADPPLLRDQENVCESERFTDQPSVSFCSGVLVDWDLVLTAGHCVRLFALEDFSVVFDYYYASDGALGLGRQSSLHPAEIVAEALDPAGTSPRLDYAWIRLEHAVGSERRPVPVHLHPALAGNDALISVGTPHGVPTKIDTSGVIRDPRDGSDYFVAQADVSAGWSGGGAFAPSLGLLGVLARGEADFIPTAEGCNTEFYASDDIAAGEEFTYASAALAGLCASSPQNSSLCRRDCEEPCQALSLAGDATGAENPDVARAGCSLASGARAPAFPLLFVGLGYLFRLRLRRPSR